MRLDETCSPRKSQHLHAPWFLRQHLHMGCSWCMERVKFNNKGSQRAESTGSAQRCSQSAQFVLRDTRSESKGNGKCLMYWPQIHRGFHLRKESVRNISPPTKRKFQPRSLQLSRGATAWLSTTRATSGAALRIINLLGKVGRKREEGNRAQKCTARGVCPPLPWSLSDKEGPDDLCECWFNTHTHSLLAFT